MGTRATHENRVCITAEAASLVRELVASLEVALHAAHRLFTTLEPKYDHRPAPVESANGLGAAGPAEKDLHVDCVTHPVPTIIDQLSRREEQVLGLLAVGHSNKEIAVAFCLSPRTVQRHIANIYLKIGARNRAEATAFALTQQLLVSEAMRATIPAHPPHQDGHLEHLPYS